MPCYDPPPPWEGAARASGEQAAKLLCEEISNNMEACGPSWLRWYIGHRNIDLHMARVPYYGKIQHKEPPAAILASIARAESLLAVQNEPPVNDESKA